MAELACGGGVTSTRLAAAGLQVRGVDQSEAMIRRARRDVPGGEFEVGSLYHFELRDEVAVYAVGEPLNYVADPDAPPDRAALIARLAGALPAGGLLLFDLLEDRGDENAGLERTSVREGDGWQVESVASLASPTRLHRDIRFRIRGAPDVRRELHRLDLIRADDAAGWLEAAGLRVDRRDAWGDWKLPGPRCILLGEKD